MRALVVGLGASGEAAARRLQEEGAEVLVADDAPSEASFVRAERLGVELVSNPDLAVLERLVSSADLVVPSPGVPFGHPVFSLAAAAGVAVRGELELAWRGIGQPVVAVTGTNGKTTVTTLVAAMLEASGVKALAAGNIGRPLTEVADSDADVVVAEVSSFQLQFVDRFHPAVAVWLNWAPDHLDWHPDIRSYAAAKARIWARQTPDDVAVANADDAMVMAWAAAAPSRLVTFGLAAPADYSVRDGRLVGGGLDLLAVDEMARSLPHDLANALAAAAAATAVGATSEGVADALRTFSGLAHRLSLVADHRGVRWYDDSKATNPHAAAASASAFESVVLLAGGRNKGLDLRTLAAGAGPSVRHVVALGEAAPEVELAFAGRCPVQSAASMVEAVSMAAIAARPGDTVLLAPGCASFDWYDSYAARGDDFAAVVSDLIGGNDG
ncbi:MAG: UDP-N-acetylmuramoyl-L-alanine--D-glutamate ligase [Acidimicrobiales bacterium]